MQREIRILPGLTSPLIPTLSNRGVTARAVVWPGVGAEARSMHLIQLSANGRTPEMQHKSEAVYYVIRGSITVKDQSSHILHSIPDGGVIFIEPDTPYVLWSGGEAELIGGPCPPDVALYEGMSWK